MECPDGYAVVEDRRRHEQRLGRLDQQRVAQHLLAETRHRLAAGHLREQQQDRSATRRALRLRDRKLPQPTHVAQLRRGGRGLKRGIASDKDNGDTDNRRDERVRKPHATGIRDAAATVTATVLALGVQHFVT
jgi:hypothetical protein